MPSTVGGLKGFKNTMWEGGLRVPAIIEWPKLIKPQISKYPVSTMDMFPTIMEIVGLNDKQLLKNYDGESIFDIFNSKKGSLLTPVPSDAENISIELS